MASALRVGGLGTGRVFREGHLPVYAGLEHVQLTAVYDPDRSAATQASGLRAVIPVHHAMLGSGKG
jgi:predicted dehydrogenase